MTYPTVTQIFLGAQEICLLVAALKWPVLLGFVSELATHGSHTHTQSTLHIYQQKLACPSQRVAHAHNVNMSWQIFNLNHDYGEHTNTLKWLKIYAKKHIGKGNECLQPLTLLLVLLYWIIIRYNMKMPSTQYYSLSCNVYM